MYDMYGYYHMHVLDVSPFGISNKSHVRGNSLIVLDDKCYLCHSTGMLSAYKCIFNHSNRKLSQYQH